MKHTAKKRRPLVFACTEIDNLAVISHVMSNAELAWKGRNITLILPCPCGGTHEYQLRGGSWLLSKSA